MRKNLFLTGLISASLLLYTTVAISQEGEKMRIKSDQLNNSVLSAKHSNRETAQRVVQPAATQAANNVTGKLALAADIQVNNNAGAGTTAGFTQSETTVIAFGNNVVTAFNDAGSYGVGSDKFTGWSYSSDGGATFTDGGSLPASAIGDAGDPVLARNNTTGRIYLSTLGFNYPPATIQMFRSDNNGVSWLPAVNATPGGDDEDKQWVAVDNFAGPGNGNVYLLSRRFGAGPGIYFFRSTDNGTTFGPSGGTLIVGGSQGAYIAIGPDHSIYAFWYAGSTLRMRKSTDQGATFGAAVTVASGLLGGSNGDLNLVGVRKNLPTPAYFRSNSFPHAAVNPVNGNIYVTYNSDVAGADKADVFFVQSTNGGATWSAPAKVNDDATTTDQWQPTVAVTPDGQHIGFFYYSRQEDAANNNLFKYYGRIATLSGATVTFDPSFAVSNVASLPEFGRDGYINPTYMGDYNTASATNTDFQVTWSDNRDDLAGDVNRKDPNVYYKKISIAVVDNEPPKITCPSNVVASNDAGLCSRVINVGTPTATDNSGTVTVTSSRSDGKALSDPYPVGVTTITWTATDPSNNKADCVKTVTINDTELPNALCKNVTITLANGTATITAADVNNGSTDNCGIQSVSVSKTSFDCSNVGPNTVTLTVTDIHGNSQTCMATVTVVGEAPVCSIASIPSNNTYTGGVSTNLYIGYGPQSTTLKVTTPASGAPYTYSWSPVTGLSSSTSSAPVFTPTAPGTYLFTVTVTNKYGCSNTCSITICVLDVRVPGTDGKKIYVCHMPPGNPANQNTLSISINAVPAHIPGHSNDHLGTCNQVPCAPQTMTIASGATSITEAIGIRALSVSALPNPSSGSFKVAIQSDQNQPVNVKVIDLYGRVIFKQANVAPNSTLSIGENFLNGTYLIEVMQGDKTKMMKVIKMK